MIIRNRSMQKSFAELSLHIHICTSNQELLYRFDITTANRTMNRSMFAAVFTEEFGGLFLAFRHGKI